MTTKTQSNEEVIEQLFGKPCDEYEQGCATCEVYRILAQKDAEIADARREGFIEGQRVGQRTLISHTIMEFSLPFERTPPDQTDTNPTN